MMRKSARCAAAIRCRLLEKGRGGAEPRTLASALEIVAVRLKPITLSDGNCPSE